ncbi:flagellar hook-length control protein FliK [Paraliobacillus zengyii]|uniref:flagellar hook-length control protein FliK n=1 Tax=Paraliobacillus zengyii TaxID=2213194 RepID=UPI000DD42E94|nr:flagellar hook-length control protein FliK [Paraliobacillus zengyii]
MNVTGLLNQQTTQLGNTSTKKGNEGQSVFGSLLESIGSKVNNSLIGGQSKSSTREQLESSEEANSIETLFSSYLAGDNASLEPLLEQLKIKSDELTTSTDESIRIAELAEQLMLLENDTDISNQMKSLWDQLEPAFEQLSTDLAESTSEEDVLELVEQWIAVSEEAPEQSSNFLKQQNNTELATWLENIVSSKAIAEENTKTNQASVQMASLEQLFQNNTLQNVDVNQQSIEKIANLWKQVEQVAAQVSSGKFDQESSVKVLKLLEQWTSLEKSTPLETANLLQEKKGTNEGQLWSRLLGTYQKRTEGQMQAKYQSSAMVTTTDVSKWMKNAVTSLSSETKATVNAETLATGQQISKLEQFVVHVKQSTQTNQKSTSDNLMEEFQKVIKSSKFMSGPNGSNELLLKLKPNHLGDISVKLTQINGEMMVKITATTQAAKDALETNIQQLRHMFSPNQVVIEKQDAQMFQQTQEESNSSFDEQMSESSQQEDAEGKEQNDGEQDQSSISFEEVLMNERV